TLLKLKAEGTAVADLTRGELGTRGTPEIRAQEAAAAARILGLTQRINLGFRDGFFDNDEKHRLEVVRVIRELRPQIVLCNAPSDRHPDHGRAYRLVCEAAFLAGLPKIETYDPLGRIQEPHRPAKVVAYIQDQWITPSFVVDISEQWPGKIAAIEAYRSQFYVGEPDDGPQTYISTPLYRKRIEARARAMGHFIGVEYGEGFWIPEPLKLASPLSLL
ncbi:MAG: bacillithiol biosynthesis deacetylase BshB1, partial [Bacteroidia bacterium]|nr:bacillithiol biosynthesis deacetylase BshB1 [Bacteroidia bacterium]